MKKVNYFLILFLLCFFISPIISQKWKYSKGGNTFDGTYRTANVIGKGGKFPYNNPLFVVNLFNDENLNVYISNAGYFGCDNNEIYFVFNNDSNKLYYSYNVETNVDNDVLFIRSIISEDKITDDIDYLDIDEFLEKIKKSSTMDVRVTSDCIKYDFVFSLSGSTKAIDFVLNDYFVKLRKRLEEIKLEEEKLKKEEERIIAEQEKKRLEEEKLKKEEERIIAEQEKKRLEEEKLKKEEERIIAEQEKKRLEEERLKEEERIRAEQIKSDSITKAENYFKFQIFEQAVLDMLLLAQLDNKEFSFTDKLYVLRSKKKGINKTYESVVSNINWIDEISLEIINLNTKSDYNKELISMLCVNKSELIINFINENKKEKFSNELKHLYLSTCKELLITLNTPNPYKDDLLISINEALGFHK